MNPRTIDPRVGSFVAAGAIRVTAAALDIARAFAEDIKRERPNEDWIITFDWAFSRRARKTPGGEWQDLGAGLDVTAFRRQQIPQSAIQQLEGVEIVIKVPEQMLAQSPDRTIDVDPDNKARVRFF